MRVHLYSSLGLSQIILMGIRIRMCDVLRHGHRGVRNETTLDTYHNYILLTSVCDVAVGSRDDLAAAATGVSMLTAHLHTGSGRRAGGEQVTPLAAPHVAVSPCPTPATLS